MRDRREPPASASSGGTALDQRAADLMARAAEGDRSAWRALYVEHRDFVYVTALRFLGDEAGARDATQDVFVSLLSQARSYRPTASFSTYLRRVTVNRCINERSSARVRRRAEAPGPVALDPDQRSRISGLRERLMSTREEHARRMAALRRELASAAVQQPAAPATVDRALRAIADTQAAYQRAVVEHFLAVRDVLRPEQRPAFEKMVVEQMSTGGGPRHEVCPMPSGGESR